MARFIKQTDYAGSIKLELKKLITGTGFDEPPAAKQIVAEDMAIAMIRKYIGGVADCDAIFITPADSDPDIRDMWMVNCIIVIALYKLYHQTGTKDIPEHRASDYDDIVSWLKDVGAGNITAELPSLPDDDGDLYTGEIRFNSRPPKNQKW